MPTEVSRYSFSSREAWLRFVCAGLATAVIDGLLQRGEKDVFRKVVEAVERILLPRVLQATHGHQTQASEILGLNRATLRHKLRALGLALDKVVTEETDETG